MKRELIEEKVKNNEFLNNETFDTFVMRKMNLRPGKRVIFQNSTSEQKQKDLLDSYLTTIRDREREKLEQKRRMLDEER